MRWLIMLAATLLGALASAAEPDEPTPDGAMVPCQAEPANPSAPFAQELDRAIALYRRGCHRWALDLLRALDIRRRVEPVARTTAVRAMLYLGELELVLGRRDEARGVFESVLLFDPNASMSLLEHDPDAVDLFTRTRAAMPASVLVTPTPPDFPNSELPRRRAITYLPLGIGVRAAGYRDEAITFAIIEGLWHLNMFAAWYMFQQRFPSSAQLASEQAGDLRYVVGLKAWNYGAATAWLTTWGIAQASITRR